MITRVLPDIAQKLPFPAKVVTQKDLDNWDHEDRIIKTMNINELRWEWCIKNNILNVINYISPYDIEWCHLGPNCR
jgi:large subunit ribosomal protein L16